MSIPHRPPIKLVNLATGTHVVLIRAETALYVMATNAGGTVNVAFTYDDDVVVSGAPGSQTFPASVNQIDWTTGAVASGFEKIEGPVRAVEITIATSADNDVTLAYQ